MEIVSHSRTKKIVTVDRRGVNKSGIEVAASDGIGKAIDKGKYIAVSSEVKGSSHNRFSILAGGLDKAKVLRDIINSLKKAFKGFSGQELNENIAGFSGDLPEDVDDVHSDLVEDFLYLSSTEPQLNV
ncbi:hypothetical protein PTKIN_Ptkin16aG0069100 [Pterospermum kingtungense]